VQVADQPNLRLDYARREAPSFGTYLFAAVSDHENLLGQSVRKRSLGESQKTRHDQLKGAGMQRTDHLNYGLSGESIVCFAGEDWWYHHPHSKNHILKRLAKQNKVLFVNSITMGLPAVSSPDFFLKIRRKLRSSLRWLRRVPEGLYVMTPISLPLYGSRIGRALNRWLLVLQLRLVMILLGMRKPIIWVAIPSAADVVASLEPKLLLYQVSDKYDANEDSALSREVIRRWDRQLKERAAVVMYSGRKLFAESEVPHRYFLEQAVDFDHFAAEAPEVSPEVRSIPKPLLGYFGYMDHVMDVPLMEEVAKKRPQWHWLLIGGKSNLVQFNSPNFHYVGAKSYRDLPSYLRPIDIYVLPWNQCSAFTAYGSAIKVREYLATGKPVVISPLYEYLETPGLRIYRTTEEFITAVEHALLHDTTRDRELRQSVVRDCTWDVRAQQVGHLIAKLVRDGTRLAAPAAEETTNDELQTAHRA
jgi:glycosyltransferase involved in cell wall biosynthesis